MNKLLSVRFASRVGSAISVFGVVTAHAAVVPPNLAVAEMTLPPEVTFLVVAPVLLVTFGFIVWMFLLLLKKPERKSRQATAGTSPQRETFQPASGSTARAVWFDGALDRSRARRVF